MRPETAAWLMAPLVMTGFSALIAFVTRRRAAFIAGTIATWIVASLPEPRVYAQYRSLEAAVMGSLRETVERSWNTVPMAAVIGVIAGLLYSEWSLRRR